MRPPLDLQDAIAYVWRNLPLDVGYVLTYFVAHEAHHRGQIVMAARQLNCRLSVPITAGLWEWRTREREAAQGGQRTKESRRFP